MSKVTPIRPGSQPPSGGDDATEQPINRIESHLAQARAICDLVECCEREDLHDDTLGWAMFAVQVSTIALFDGAPSTLFEGVPSSHSHTL
jgi:hypothetical protein